MNAPLFVANHRPLMQGNPKRFSSEPRVYQAVLMEHTQVQLPRLLEVGGKRIARYHWGQKVHKSWINLIVIQPALMGI